MCVDVETSSDCWLLAYRYCQHDHEQCPVFALIGMRRLFTPNMIGIIELLLSTDFSKGFLLENSKCEHVKIQYFLQKYFFSADYENMYGKSGENLSF